MRFKPASDVLLVLRNEQDLPVVVWPLGQAQEFDPRAIQAYAGC